MLKFVTVLEEGTTTEMLREFQFFINGCSHMVHVDNSGQSLNLICYFQDVERPRKTKAFKCFLDIPGPRFLCDTQACEN